MKPSAAATTEKFNFRLLSPGVAEEEELETNIPWQDFAGLRGSSFQRYLSPVRVLQYSDHTIDYGIDR
jgi:hypothetical protein